MEEKLLFYFNLINESLLERKETNGWYHYITNHGNYLILVDGIIMSWKDGDEVNFSHFPIGSDRLWSLNKCSLTDQFGDKIDIVKTEKGWLIGEKECISPEQILNEIDNFIEGI